MPSVSAALTPSTKKRAIVPLCNRYAAITRGTATAATPAPTPTSAAPKQPDAADAVRQGVDAVRRLLPF